MRTARPRKREPKYLRARERLRRHIAEGDFPPGSRLPAVTKLPRLLGVGQQTVLRALGDLAREGLIVQRRGSGSYVAKPQRPPLIPGRSLKLCVLWPYSAQPENLLQNVYHLHMLRGALAAWGLEGIEPTSTRVDDRTPTRMTWTSPDRSVIVECLGESHRSYQRHPPLEAVVEGRFDAILALNIIEEPWVDRMLGLGIPTVLADFPCERFDYRADQVFFDPLPAMRNAVRFCTDQGHSRIHFVGLLLGVPAPNEEMSYEEWRTYKAGKHRVEPDSLLRLGAFRLAMDDNGLPVGKDAVHFEWYDRDSCFRLAERLLARPKEERPEAVVCHGIDQAEALMEAFAERGLRLQGVGATEREYRGPAWPIRANPRELGSAAAYLLVWRLKEPARPFLRLGLPMTFTPPGAVPVDSRIETKATV